MKLTSFLVSAILFASAAQAMPAKLTCDLSVADGTFPGRVDRFYFSDPASPNAPIYWQSWINRNRTEMTTYIVVGHQVDRCPDCFTITAEHRTGGVHPTRSAFLFELQGNRVTVQYTVVPGGPSRWVPFARGKCR